MVIAVTRHDNWKGYWTELYRKFPLR